MFRVIAAVAGVLLTVAFSGSASAAPAPLALTPTDTDAVLLVELEAAPNITSIGDGWVLAISEFSPGEQKFLISFNADYWAGAHGPSSGPPRFVAIRTRPSIYGVESISVGYWQACFNGGSVAFDLPPGKVTFLGRVSAIENIGEIVEAARSGKLPSYAVRAQPLYKVSTLHLTPPSALPGWEARAAAFLGSTYPGITAPLRAAETQPITFGKGHTLGGDALCGASRWRNKKGPR